MTDPTYQPLAEDELFDPLTHFTPAQKDAIAQALGRAAEKLQKILAEADLAEAAERSDKRADRGVEYHAGFVQGFKAGFTSAMYSAVLVCLQVDDEVTGEATADEASRELEIPGRVHLTMLGGDLPGGH